MKSLFTSLVFCISTISAWAQGAALPYYSGFDTPQEQAGWNEYRTGVISSYDWGMGGTQGFGGSACLTHDYNVGGNPNDTVIDWFVSPALNLSSPSIISLKVLTSGFSTPFPDNCDVWFGTGNQDPAIGNFALIGNVSYMNPQFQWLDTSFSIPYNSDSGFIAIKYKTIGAAWMTYNIDNITVRLDSTASVDDHLLKSSLKIFPNPFSVSTTVFLDNNLIGSSIELQMTDIYGREIKRISGINSNQITINRDDLPGGIYFIRIMKDHMMIDSRKIIII